MHEWALAESIITTALDVAKKEHLKTITQVTIHIGELQQIEREIFTFALKESAALYPKKFPKISFQLKTEKSTLQCNSCLHEWAFQDMKKKLNEDTSEAIHFIPEVIFVHTRCPTCGSPDFSIKKGRGVTVSSIKGTR